MIDITIRQSNPNCLVYYTITLGDWIYDGDALDDLPEEELFMTDQHPLTDEICRAIDDKASTKTNDWKGCMRAGADWQLEQCIGWLDDTDCDDPQETAQRLREAMRPTTTQEDK